MKALRNNRNSKKKILIWGAGGHAKVVADIARRNGFQVAGFIDDHNPDRAGELFCDAEILSGVNWPGTKAIRDIIIAIGDNRVREEKAQFAKAGGFRLMTVVHPHTAIAPDVRLGAGTVVMAGAVINSGAIIGENAIINTSASVDHDCVIEDVVHISPGARIAGGVKIGSGTWIGIGAAVIEQIRVGSNVIVGAGAVVIREIPSGWVVAGVPARKIKSRRKQ